MERWQPNLEVEIWPEAVPGTTAMLAELGYRGLFFFDGRMFDIGRYDPAVQSDPQNAMKADAPEQYDPDLYVKNFFFTPV